MPSISTLMQDVLEPHHWPCKEKKDRRPKDSMKVTQVIGLLSVSLVAHTQILGRIWTSCYRMQTIFHSVWASGFLIAFLFFKYMKAE